MIVKTRLFSFVKQNSTTVYEQFVMVQNQNFEICVRNKKNETNFC